MKNSFGAIVLIIVGSVLLAQNLGYLDVSLIQLIRVWWPVILNGLGISFFFTPDSGRHKDKQ